MEQFNKISIAEISKKDIKLILEALLFTGNNKNDDNFLNLRNDILEELSILLNCSKNELLNTLNNI